MTALEQSAHDQHESDFRMRAASIRIRKAEDLGLSVREYMARPLTANRVASAVGADGLATLTQ